MQVIFVWCTHITGYITQIECEQKLYYTLTDQEPHAVLEVVYDLKNDN